MSKAVSKSTSKRPAKRFDFNKKFVALEDITQNFSDGKYDVETGLQKFEEGLQLAQELKEYLENVENTIESIKGKYHELTQDTEKN